MDKNTNNTTKEAQTLVDSSKEKTLEVQAEKLICR